ncbi:hypothetical protein SORBI_3006G256801 [Sorghum bicolor]|uniref:Uncharacterized protein n=1 Tax=Sorghum bicolor TaxID=4558 RepID=A0A1Z5RFJ9_SORBI|nr:hypothetical protein SORBI_3006G256801 [Sorghum bicolor]
MEKGLGVSRMSCSARHRARDSRLGEKHPARDGERSTALATRDSRRQEQRRRLFVLSRGKNVVAILLFLSVSRLSTPRGRDDLGGGKQLVTGEVVVDDAEKALIHLRLRNRSSSAMYADMASASASSPAAIARAPSSVTPEDAGDNPACSSSSSSAPSPQSLSSSSPARSQAHAAAAPLSPSPSSQTTRLQWLTVSASEKMAEYMSTKSKAWMTSRSSTSRSSTKPTTSVAAAAAMSAAVGEDQLTTEEERAGGSIGPGRVRASRQAGSSGGGRGGEITRGGRFVFIWGARDGIEARSVQFGWRARTVFLKFEFVVGKEAEVFGAPESGGGVP